MGNHIWRIRDGAFDGCGALKKVKLPAALTEIPAKAFMNCKKLTSVKMDNKVTTIGHSAFSGCRSLKSVRLSALLKCAPVWRRWQGRMR